MNTSGWTRAGAPGRTRHCASATTTPRRALRCRRALPWVRCVTAGSSISRCRCRMNASPHPDHMRRWRFLVDPAPTPANPDQLPIGFTRHFDPHIGEDVLDITCAACHTGEIHYTQAGKTTRHPHRRRPGHARLHRHVAWQLRAHAGRVAARHRRQPVEVRPLREEGAGRGLPRRQAASCEKALRRHAQGHGATAARTVRAAQALPGARGLRPHRCAGPHRQHRVRRSSRRG